MVGNDIVDLEEAKRVSNWQRTGFLDKLFTSKEKLLIHSSENPFRMVWQLWSMKEAAYKLYTQQSPSRFYNPIGFECSFQNKNGIVKFKDFKCMVKSQIRSKYMLSEARFTDAKMTSKVIKLKSENSKNKSNLIKNALLNELSKIRKVSIENLNFQKSEFGIPMVFNNSEKIQVSLSHHGLFGAFAFSSKKIQAY